MNSHMDQSIKGQFPITRLRVGLFQIGLILAILYVISRYDYLLFHSLAEFISASIALGIFMLAWNSRKFFTNNYYLFLGVAFLASGIITFIHALSYRGMGVIPGTDTDANLATQLWLANQYLLAITFVVAPFFLKRRLSTRVIFLGYVAALVFILLSIFDWKIIPAAYIERTGLTSFKKISDYVITSLFLIAFYLFHKKRRFINQRSLRLTSVVLIFFAISTWLFTLYIGVYDFSNMLGHLFQIMAYYASYLAIVEMGLMRPYQSIFKELNENRLVLKNEKDRLTGILDTMEDGIYIVNRNDDIIYANPALQKDFGAVKDQKCFEYLHNESTPCPWCKNQEVFEEKKIQRWEWYYPKVKKTYDLISSPFITSDGTIAKMAIFRDITERKKIEKAKDDFISLASHQLRTPLANISLSSELMMRNLEKYSPDEQKNFIKEINKASKRMGVMVSNLLNISRIEMNTFDINEEAIDIGSNAREMVREFVPLMEEKNINYSISITDNLPIIYFDKNILRIIIENLLTNSLRYTPKKGIINFQMKKDDGDILIRVEDSGCGIPEEQKGNIFQKSFRTDTAKAITSEGAGLGLYMIRQVCDRIGAQIWFESKLDEGTIFYISLPIKDNHQLRII